MSIMMVIMGQLDPENQDPNFKPTFFVGCPEVLDPYNDVMLPSYGITDQQADSQLRDVYRFWRKSDGVSGGKSTIEALGG